MKSFNGLFSDMTEQEEIKQSIIEAAQEKMGSSRDEKA